MKKKGMFVFFISVTKYLTKPIYRKNDLFWLMVSEVSFPLAGSIAFRTKANRTSWRKSVTVEICSPPGIEEADRKTDRCIPPVTYFFQSDLPLPLVSISSQQCHEIMNESVDESID
jgi:hypothetical protein